MRTSTLNCKGEATYNVESGQLEAELSAQVLPGLRRATSGELADLAGISVPLQISGPWATAEVRLRLGEASGTALAALQKTRQARATPGTAVGTAEASPGAGK